jgi:hypothetical protein
MESCDETGCQSARAGQPADPLNRERELGKFFYCPIVWTSICSTDHVWRLECWSDARLDAARGEIPKLRENPESFLHRPASERLQGTVCQGRYGNSEKDWAIRSQAPKLGDQHGEGSTTVRGSGQPQETV